MDVLEVAKIAVKVPVMAHVPADVVAPAKALVLVPANLAVLVDVKE